MGSHHQRGSCIDQTQFGDRIFKLSSGVLEADTIDDFIAVLTDPPKEPIHVGRDDVGGVLEEAELGAINITLADRQDQTAKVAAVAA